MFRSHKSSAADCAFDAAASAASEGSEALKRSKDELYKEFRNLIDEGEALLKSTTGTSGDGLKQAHAQFRDTLAAARSRAVEWSTAAQEGGRRAFNAADDYVHSNPWPAVGVAVGLGFVIGALALRR